MGLGRALSAGGSVAARRRGYLRPTCRFSESAKRSGLTLIPGRQRHKLNSQMTDGIAALRKPDFAAINTNIDDAAARRLKDGDLAVIESRYGRTTGTVVVDGKMASGCVSFPHGFENQNVGHLTSSTQIDPLSGMVIQNGLEAEVLRAS